MGPQTISENPNSKVFVCPHSWTKNVNLNAFRGGMLEKEMATHSGILAWEIPCTEAPGRLQPLGLQRVEHDLALNNRGGIYVLLGRNPHHSHYMYILHKPLYTDSGGCQTWSLFALKCCI